MNKMFNFSHIYKNYFVSHNHQTVRWIRPRKPFWLGMAKTKLFKIKEKKSLPKEEEEERNRLRKEYYILRNSLCNFIELNHAADKGDFEKNIAQSVSEKSDSNFVKDLEKRKELSYIINDTWNHQIAEEREKRMQDLANDKLKKIEKRISEVEEHKKNLLSLVDKIVQQEIEKSKSFITFENLEKEIDKSIENIKEYNFAIDLTGKKYEGSQSFKNLSPRTLNIIDDQ